MEFLIGLILSFYVEGTTIAGTVSFTDHEMIIQLDNPTAERRVHQFQFIPEDNLIILEGGAGGYYIQRASPTTTLLVPAFSSPSGTIILQKRGA